MIATLSQHGRSLFREAAAGSPALWGVHKGGGTWTQDLVIGISVFELQMPHSRSLKQKRRVLKSLIERIHRRFRVSIAETDFHDLRQRAEVTLAAVTQNGGENQRMMDSIRELIDSEPEAVLLRWDPQLLEEMG